MNFVWNFHSKWKFVDIFQFNHDNFEFLNSEIDHPVCGKLKNTPYILKHKAVKNQNALHAKNCAFWKGMTRGWVEIYFRIEKVLYWDQLLILTGRGRGNPVLLWKFFKQLQWIYLTKNSVTRKKGWGTNCNFDVSIERRWKKKNFKDDCR